MVLTEPVTIEGKRLATFWMPEKSEPHKSQETDKGATWHFCDSAQSPIRRQLESAPRTAINPKVFVELELKEGGHPHMRRYLLDQVGGQLLSWIAEAV